MKIAFIILAYKFPKQLDFLLSRLNSENHFFFIHIDLRSDFADFEEILAKYQSSVYLLPRTKSYWGSYNCVEVVRRGLEVAFNHRIQFDFFIHLSGQDLPLKSNHFIDLFFEENKHKSFINLVNSSSDKISKRLEKCKFFIADVRYTLRNPHPHFLLGYLGLIWKYLIRYFDSRVNYFESEFYFSLNRDFVGLLLNQFQKEKLLTFRLQFSEIPEEIVLATLIGKIPDYDVLIHQEEFRLFSWTDESKSPKELDQNDYFELLDSKFLFGRKFNIFNG
ncbi:beta-1,6-N-acetylglucosaminyltransferase [Algoriphagus yeomjeoni]|uniref:Peptide O-xylosyltransferase n=1 Tax=Algoriphagus yeomjeoni TaxID=291403 RepID=A0A327P3D7_9BACT|nr:beta-1,6-N-acetylglucosaminyltransferase [Algoriphagus yeomjeoni]RAI85584.1 core-2/I-Branching enzyme [Algoriphagus yeomjeoni]